MHASSRTTNAMPYDLDRLQSDIAQVDHDQASFGTGRLVAKNLVLTAAHVLWNTESEIGPYIEDWKVRLARDRIAGEWTFRRGNRCVWHDRVRDLALIQLVDPQDGPQNPLLRLRVAKITTNEPHLVEARGYPRASRDVDAGRDLIPAHGTLSAADSRRKLRFAVAPPELPDNPHTGWPGMSGSAVMARDCPDPDIIWVYGVICEVPAQFQGVLTVARLADAWQDKTFRSLLVEAGAPNEIADDPTKQKGKPIHGVTDPATEEAVCQNADAEFKIFARQFYAEPILKRNLEIEKLVNGNYGPFHVFVSARGIRIEYDILPLIKELIRIESNIRSKCHIPFSQARIASIKDKIHTLVKENWWSVTDGAHEDAIKHVVYHQGELPEYKEIELSDMRDKLLNENPDELFAIADELLLKAYTDSILVAHIDRVNADK